MKKKKEKKRKNAIMLLMICIALEESKFELSSDEDDDSSINFIDPITDICGCISLKKDMINILLIDERDELPSQSIVKEFEKDYHSEFRIDCDSNHNALLFYYNNITVPENTTMHTFQALIMNAVITVLRFRSILEGTDDEE